jgi:hypothetical protein
VALAADHAQSDQHVHVGAEPIQCLRTGEGPGEIRQFGLRAQRERDFLHCARKRRQIPLAHRAGAVGELEANPNAAVPSRGIDGIPLAVRLVAPFPPHRLGKRIVDQAARVIRQVRRRSRPRAVELDDEIDGRVELRRGLRRLLVRAHRGGFRLRIAQRVLDSIGRVGLSYRRPGSRRPCPLGRRGALAEQNVAVTRREGRLGAPPQFDLLPLVIGDHGHHDDDPDPEQAELKVAHAGARYRGLAVMPPRPR